MIAFVFVAFLQTQPLEPVAEPVDPAAAPAVKAEEKPELVCTMEPITGTRAKKQKVCKTPGYLKGAERSKDMIRQIQGGSGNVQPTLPKGTGG
ncbi:MAG: hypothetical protein QM773_19150 [Hyphomonadaceae bacterium]